MNRPMKMDVSLGYATSTEWEGQRPVLRVEDHESLETLVALTLTPEQFTALMGSRFFTAEGQSTAHPNRLGFRRHTTTYPLHSGLPYRAEREQLEAALAEVASLPDGCEVQFRRQRGEGWEAVVFWWGGWP